MHVILRGGSRGTNYDSASVKSAVQQVEKISKPELPFLPAVMVDASVRYSCDSVIRGLADAFLHQLAACQLAEGPPQPAEGACDERGSGPETIFADCYRLQVIADVCQQIRGGEKGIMGVMVESNLEEGAQKAPNGREGLKRGVSITDACVDWQTTKKLLHDLNDVSPNPLTSYSGSQRANFRAAIASQAVAARRELQ